MIIKNGNVFCDNGLFAVKDLRIEGDQITAIEDPCSNGVHEYGDAGQESEIIDAAGYYVIPGFVDIHFHGCVGHDFCDGTSESFDAIAAYELANGITSMSPATMTLSREQLTKIFKEAGRYENKVGSTLRGITMEGPFVSMANKGAQNGDYIHKPDYVFYKEMQDYCGGLIKQVAVAPEEDDDFAFTRQAADEVVISVAHTVADYDRAKEAFENGANHVTHLYNAMPSLHHRKPGVIAAAAEQPHVFAELICDGIHIHPAMVRLAFNMFGCDRICMISDSMMATGMTDGDYALGGQAVKVTGKLATLADGTIAGSASNLFDCFRVAVKEMGIPLEQAITACTLTPARSLGFDDECGSITVGKCADLLILDQDLNLVQIIHHGLKTA